MKSRAYECRNCGAVQLITASEESWMLYDANLCNVQDAFPCLSADEREALVMARHSNDGRTIAWCGPCFDKLPGL